MKSMPKKRKALSPLHAWHILFDMKKARFFLMLTALGLAGCSTVEGLKQDIASGYKAVSGKIAQIADPEKEAKKQLPVYDGECPPVSVRPDLARLVEFYDEKNPSDAAKVSEVLITDVRNTCRIEGDKIIMQIDMALSGKTGPKARKQPKDQPNFAYPYFVAVTNNQGQVIFKEIFAVSLAYGREENALNQTESIFQNMPVPATSDERYSVIVGFQLTDAQLAYNHANMPPVPVSAPLAQQQAPVQLIPAAQ